MKSLSLTDRAMKGIEHLGSKTDLIWRTYYSLFYRKILEREITLCGLEPGSKVIHVGCGALPLTVLTLARLGMEVEAIERDPVAAKQASVFLRKHAPYNKTRLVVAEGLEFDYREADAVWISLSVSPKGEILRRILSMIKNDARVVCRNPRGFLSLIYNRINDEASLLSCPSQRTRQPLGKESFVISRNGRNNPKINSSEEFFDNEKTGQPSLPYNSFLNFPQNRSEHKESCLGKLEIPLTTLKNGVDAVISYVPNIPLLPPLGFRPGKKVCVRGMGCLGGPVFAEIEKRNVALGRNLAREIKVMLIQEEG